MLQTFVHTVSEHAYTYIRINSFRYQYFVYLFKNCYNTVMFVR